MSIRLPRRGFLGGATVALAACAKKNEDEPPKGPRPGAPQEGEVPLPAPSVAAATMPKRQLGKTGESVSIVGLGGFHMGLPKDESESIRLVRSAIDRGINFMDNCWDYNDGRSEERMGKALKDGYRQKAFLMTKLDGRTKKAAAEQLEQSLRRLGTDRIDLVQIHEVIRPTDPERCFAAGGCIEALLDAKKAGKLRFIGFTGHKDPDIHLAMLKAADDHQFAFDTVQMPLNVMDAHYRSFEKMVLPVLVKKGIGVLGMKSMGSGTILESKAVTAVECLHYAMSLPTSVVITGCDSMGILDQAIAAALSFKPMEPAQVTALLDKTKDLAKDGRFERFKTSTQFDGTYKHPEWLEKASI
ncbi:MAG: Nucleoside-diphosphate-sugar epimerase [Labilithrix sp.]|nr:Nucleoside-diphosphate-sugar epimerase [Labilithrix sp.]